MRNQSAEKNLVYLLDIAVAILLAAFMFAIIFPAKAPDIVGLVPSAIGMLNTIIHEAGHMLFGFFGSWIGTAGGTIFQLMVPLVVLTSAWYNRTKIGIACCVFWFGQNFIQISPYIADANKGQLEFFQWWAAFGGPIMEKGSKDHHDWYYLLNSVNMLWASGILATLAYLLGVILMFLAIVYLFAPPALRETASNRVYRFIRLN